MSYTPSMGINYKRIVKQAFKEIEDLSRQKEEIEFRISRAAQILQAAIHMLPTDERRKLENAYVDGIVEKTVSLTLAIKEVLNASPNIRFTATAVRDALARKNFDFSQYKSNPLASIHTVLKRYKPDEVETTTVDGATAYRWIGEKPKQLTLRNLLAKLPPPIPRADFMEKDK